MCVGVLFLLCHDPMFCWFSESTSEHLYTYNKLLVDVRHIITNRLRLTDARRNRAHEVFRTMNGNKRSNLRRAAGTWRYATEFSPEPHGTVRRDSFSRNRSRSIFARDAKICAASAACDHHICLDCVYDECLCQKSEITLEPRVRSCCGCHPESPFSTEKSSANRCHSPNYNTIFF
jgi:hypothetical protein